MARQSGSDDAETILDGMRSADRPAPAPERIGAYRVEARLGHGGMGEVLLAWDERLERRVAIKRIRQEAGLASEHRERFRREACHAARLSHSAVVQVYDLISDGPDDAIVMEYVEGRTLADRLASERLETAEVLRLACEIAEGLAAAHEAGLIHRDLKAANVLVTPAGHAKILDFGLARPVVRSPEDQGFTRQGIVLGTCHAMSPEQARGDDVDERSDLFSFGALVHEMLTGRPPFRGNNSIESLRKVATEEPVDPSKARPDLPAEAAGLLRRLVAKKREDRPASAREVIEILERLRTSPSGPHTAALEGSTGGFSSGARTPLELPVQFFRAPAGWTGRHLPLTAALILLGVMALALLFATLAERRLRGFDVSVKDNVDCLSIQKQIDQGDKLPTPRNLETIDDVVQRNPDFLEAQLLGARIARSLFASSGERALAFIRASKDLAPLDSRPLYEELYLCRATQDVACAEAALEQLQTLRPGSSLLKARALVAQARGDLNQAAALLAELVKRVPTWQNRYQLASAEFRRGRIEAGRRQIEIIRQENQDNGLAKERLAWLELMYGELGRAEKIYESLAASIPDRYWDNLGAVRALSGNLERAESAFTISLEFGPNRAPALVNLAGVEWDLGQKSEAENHYKQALDRLEILEAEGGGLSLSDSLLMAICLARLGRPEAINRVKDLEPRIAHDPMLLYHSALVFTLAGDRATARAAAFASLDKGLARHWFETRTFRWLLPEIRSRSSAAPTSR